MNPYLFTNPSIAAAYQNDPRTAYAQALMQQGGSTAPVLSWGEGLARALGGALGGLQAGQVRQGYQGQDQQYRQALTAALKGDDPLAALSQSSDPTLQTMGLEYGLKTAQAKRQAQIEGAQKVADAQALGPVNAQNAALTAQATGPVDIANATAKAKALLPINVQQAIGISSANAQIDVAKAQALLPIDVQRAVGIAQAVGPVNTQNAVAQAQALGPVNAQNAALTAQATGPVQTQTAANTAQALAPIQTGQAVSQAQALMPGAVQQAGDIAKAQQAANPALVTLVAPDGSATTLVKSDPNVKTLIGEGFTERSAADPNSKPFTEDQSKTAQLLNEVLPDVQIIKDTYPALQKLTNQLAGKTPGAVANLFTSPDYQRAQNALAHLIQNNLYSLSGAQISDAEASRRAALLLPTIGESDASIADKQARIQSLVDGMITRAGPAMKAIKSTTAPPANPAAPKDPASMSDDDLLKALQQ